MVAPTCVNLFLRRMTKLELVAKPGTFCPELIRYTHIFYVYFLSKLNYYELYK